MPNTHQTCENCRFLDDIHEDGNPRCHKYPPQAKEEKWLLKKHMIFRFVNI